MSKVKEEAIAQKDQSIKRILSQNIMFVILLGLIILMTILTKGTFISPTNIVNIFTAEAGYGILALGVAFTIISKGIDLSPGSVVSLTSVIAASFAQQATYAARMYPNMTALPGILAACVGLVIGILVGMINGLLISYTKIHPFIATLGTMSAGRGLALLYSKGNPVAQLNPDFNWLGSGKLFGAVPVIVVIFIIFAFVAWFILNQTRLGRNIYAVGGNDIAAHVAGVNVEKTRVLVYTFSGLCAAAGGVVMAARSGAGNPTLGTGMELDAIAAATIGGVSQNGGLGRVSGVIAGVLILGIVKSALIYLNVSSYYQDIVKGTIIVIAVIIDMRKNRKR